MIGLHVDLVEGREAFLDGLHGLVEAAAGLADRELLASSRCHGWTVGDVLVHVHMGLQEMLLGVVSPTDAEPDTDAAGYWRHDVPSNDPNADDLAPVRFTRLVGAAYRRPSGVVGHLLPTTRGLERAVAAMTDRAVEFQGQVLAAGDFLATWAVEVAIHHLDLGPEVDVPGPAPAALNLARRTIEALAGDLPEAWTDERAVLLGAGRVALTEEESRQAGAVAEQLPALG